MFENCRQDFVQLERGVDSLTYVAEGFEQLHGPRELTRLAAISANTRYASLGAFEIAARMPAGGGLLFPRLSKLPL
jgi:hypothetical protein